MEEILSLLSHMGSFLTYTGSFLIVLTVVVVVHELGHYALARYHRVKIEAFSLGFGPELWGYTAPSGTRWRLSLIPLGGYVKMFNESGTIDLPDDQQMQSYHHKSVGQRAAIVFAGPAANFLFVIIVLTGVFAFYGRPYVLPEIGRVVPDSPAALAGLQVNDIITEVSGAPVSTVADLLPIIQAAPDQTLELVIQRNEQKLILTAQPMAYQLGERSVGRLGVEFSGRIMFSKSGNPLLAFWQAGEQTWQILARTVIGLREIILGERSFDELGGPVRIAQLSGEQAQQGGYAFLWFIAVLSVNLGLLNLLPILPLDGGHLLFHALEALRGRSISPRWQHYVSLIGLVLVLALIISVTWNDVLRFFN